MQARDFFDEPSTQPAAREPAAREPMAYEPAARETSLPKPVAAQPREPAPEVVFHAVSEHDGVVEEETHKPVRRRSRHEGGASEVPSLQLVETQADIPAVSPVADDEPPRRTKPRRRRGGEQPSEPLMLVETQPGAEGSRTDNQP